MEAKLWSSWGTELYWRRGINRRHSRQRYVRAAEHGQQLHLVAFRQDDCVASRLPAILLLGPIDRIGAWRPAAGLAQNLARP